jgi:hypothetical protein
VIISLCSLYSLCVVEALHGKYHEFESFGQQRNSHAPMMRCVN